MKTSQKKRHLPKKMPPHVRRMRLELTRSCDHYPLKVACIPISPPAHNFNTSNPDNLNSYRVPKTGLEPARLTTLAPETSASTNSAIWASLLCLSRKQMQDFCPALERQTRLELATPTLARSCSTN